MDYAKLAAELPTCDLVTIHNYYADPVKKFRDRATAEKRTAEILKKLDVDVSAIKNLKISAGGLDVINGVDDVKVTRAAKTPEKKKEKVAKEPATKGNTGNRNKGKKIFGVAPERLRKDSRRFKSYQLIKDGMTYEEYVGAGGNIADLSVMIRDGVVRAE